MKLSKNAASPIISTALIFASLFVGSTANAACKIVRGSLEERAVAPAECASPVGLCTTGNVFGKITGQFRFTASSIVNSVDTGTTGVVFVTGDSIFTNVTFGNKRGTITTKSAAVYKTTGEGELSDIQIITGGTGGLVGATGTVQLLGNFINGSGTSSFEGTICLP